MYSSVDTLNKKLGYPARLVNPIYVLNFFLFLLLSLLLMMIMNIENLTIQITERSDVYQYKKKQFVRVNCESSQKRHVS
jgi:hypothetical protein